MNSDAELLRAYVEHGSETAFATIVERHKGLVYASALRQTNDAGLAEEITQAVFVVLARKATSLNAWAGCGSMLERDPERVRGGRARLSAAGLKLD